MHPRTWFVLSLLCIAAPACARDEGARGTGSAESSNDEGAAMPEVGVAELASLLTEGRAVAVDANNEGTRERFGVIPDAKLLSSSSSYDLSELPADKGTELVFYCANVNCTASDAAAERAKASGYERVRVLRAGISGWRDAGQPTVPPSS